MDRCLLPSLTPAGVRQNKRQAIDQATLEQAREIVDAVRSQGLPALLEFGSRFGDLPPGGQLVYPAADLQAALERLPDQQRRLLTRTAHRIAAFAGAQRRGLDDLDLAIEGGRAGVRYRPVQRAGCYAPGGRYPLPSSVLMTTITAREAGVPDIWVASPRPGDLVLAAAALGGARGLLAVGGAQAIAALACGVAGVPACDVIVGPGNRYVTAAKYLVSGQVGIDMLAGPSELIVLADATADPATVAADLLAQAEHDPDAIPLLVALDPTLPARVNRELELQLARLSSPDTARQALRNGGVVVVPDLDQALALCNDLAPEHLEVMVEKSGAAAHRLNTCGAVFVGSQSAEVLGDYGAGPNHVLPTGGTARFSGALSVLDFLVGRTWLCMAQGPAAEAVARDAVALARLEGLEAHAAAAGRRVP